VAPTGGTVTITATSEGKSGTSTVTVTVAVNTVVVSPSSATILVGDTVQLSAQTLSAGGINLSRSVVWSSNNTGVATVNQSGLVTGISANQALITAASEGKTGTSTITVQAPPASPSPTLTPTVTPSITPTRTLTPTPSRPPAGYCYTVESPLGDGQVVYRDINNVEQITNVFFTAIRICAKSITRLVDATATEIGECNCTGTNCCS
jgi:plastocyanin